MRKKGKLNSMGSIRRQRFSVGFLDETVNFQENISSGIIQ